MQSQVEQKGNPNQPMIVAIRIPARLHKKLKLEAVKQERPLAELYAAAIRMYLEAQ